MTTPPFVKNYLPPIVLGLSLFTVYLLTMAPGLTWAHDGMDGGDLITAAATGGVPHPTGYPTYLLLAAFFQKLPVGSLAFRTNLMSAFVTVLAAVLIYKIVADSILPSKPELNLCAAMIAGYAFGLAPLIWSQAVITEVYALQMFLTVLVLYLYTGTAPLSNRSQIYLDKWRGIVLGITMGNHITTILLLPVAFTLGSIRPRLIHDGTSQAERIAIGRLKFDTASLFRQFLFCGLGLSLYLILPLRALAHPPVNWGNAVTLRRFWWLVSGQLYVGNLFPARIEIGEILLGVQAWASLLLQQWGLIGLILACIGLIYFFSPSRLSLFTIWQLIVSSGFAIFYRSFDSYVYLLPACISISIWIGVGFGQVIASKYFVQHRLGWAISIILLIYFLGLAACHWPQVDASKDIRAEIIGVQILESAPAHAIIFVQGDEAVFATWYFHYALKQRSDLIVIATDLLHFDWYQKNLRTTYPSLVISSPFPWVETIIIANPTHAVCYARYSEQTYIECLEPLLPLLE